MPSLMKGKVWSERKHKVTYPVYAEVKSDEIRCHVIVGKEALGPNPDRDCVEFLSYAGKPLANMERFAKDFAVLAGLSGYREFDCGFLVDNSFNESYRWVRSTKGLPPELESVPVIFILFDLPENATKFHTRLVERSSVRQMAKDFGWFNLRTPEWRLCQSEAEVDETFRYYREQGHEGAMVKTDDHLYQRGKRIDGWLKMKPENDADGVITEVHQGVSGITGELLDRVTSVTIKVESDVVHDTVAVSYATPHGIGHELGRDMLAHPEKYIGQWAEFKFMERDRQGGYRHPTFHRIREAKA